MMNDDYACISGCDFDKKFKKALKKHRCFEDDFKNLQKTILVDLEHARSTKQVSGLGAEYSSLNVFKTEMMVTELRGKDARLIWHPRIDKKEILLIDVYLKSMQENHDVELIKRSLTEYYSRTLQKEGKPTPL